MKNKIIIGVIALSLFFPPAFSLAQTTTNLQNQYMQALQALINLLIQRVNLLMDELARMKLQGSVVPEATATPIAELPEAIPTIMPFPTISSVISVVAPKSEIWEKIGRSSQTVPWELTN